MSSPNTGFKLFICATVDDTKSLRLGLCCVHTDSNQMFRAPYSTYAYGVAQEGM